MSEYPYPLEFYNSCENQYNPYDFSPNSYGYFNNNYCVNNSNFEQQNFQNNDQPSTLENSIEMISSLLELSTRQNQEINDLCNSYLCNNSSQGFQNLNSIQNSNDYDYNPCQFNFELQNEFQTQHENGNNFSNEFGNGNNLNHVTSENFCSQQIQIENSQFNNYKLDFVEQMNEIYDDHTDLLFETYMKQREQQNQISTCDESSDNPPFTQIDDFQITTFEFDNDDLNQVVENTVIELDFNSFEGAKLDLNFDLPFSENLNTTTLKLDLHDEVVDNPTKEVEFNEHEFYGLFENELLNFEGENFDHHFDFEIDTLKEIELQPIFLSTPKIIENKTTHMIFNKMTFVFPNPHSTSKSFTIWFFVLKLCLTHLTRQMNQSFVDRFIYFLTICFLVSCK